VANKKKNADRSVISIECPTQLLFLFYLRAIIKQLCAIATLQQESLSQSNIGQLLAESVDLRRKEFTKKKKKT